MGENELFVVTRSRAEPTTQIEPFAGCPQKLMAHQMLLDPTFGIATMESFEVERMRAEYRELKGLSKPDKAQEVRCQELEILLDDLPVWGVASDVERENRDLMRDIKQALAGSTP